MSDWGELDEFTLSVTKKLPYTVDEERKDRSDGNCTKKRDDQEEQIDV